MDPYDYPSEWLDKKTKNMPRNQAICTRVVHWRDVIRYRMEIIEAFETGKITDTLVHGKTVSSLAEYIEIMQEDCPINVRSGWYDIKDVPGRDPSTRSTHFKILLEETPADVWIAGQFTAEGKPMDACVFYVDACGTEMMDTLPEHCQIRLDQYCDRLVVLPKE